MKAKSGTTLIELLCVIAVLFILTSLLLPVICRSYAWAKAWIYGVYAFHSNQLNAFLDETKGADYYLTNKPCPWSFVTTTSDGYLLK